MRPLERLFILSRQDDLKQRDIETDPTTLHQSSNQAFRIILVSLLGFSLANMMAVIIFQLLSLQTEFIQSAAGNLVRSILLILLFIASLMGSWILVHRRLTLIVIWLAFMVTDIVYMGVRPPLILGHTALIILAASFLGEQTTILILTALAIGLGAGIISLQDSLTLAVLDEWSLFYIISSIIGVVGLIAYGLAQRTTDNLTEIEAQRQALQQVKDDLQRQMQEFEASQHKLHEIQTQFNIIAQHVTFFLFNINQDETITFCAGRDLRDFSQNVMSLIGQPFAQVFADMPFLVADVRAALRGDVFYRMREIADETYEIIYTPVYDAQNAISNVIGIALNVTTEKRALTALLDSEAKFRVMFEESPDMIVIIDGNTELIHEVSPAVKSLLGYTPDDLIGQHFSALLPVEKVPDWDASFAAFGTTIDTLPFPRRDGSICTMEMNATLIPWNGAEAIMLTLRDISMREEAKRKLLDAERLQSQVEMRENFINIIAHDIRSPLGSIYLAADMIRQYHQRMDEAQLFKRVNTILDEVDRATQTVEDLLLVRKGLANAIEVHIDAFEPDVFSRELFQQALEDYRALKPDNINLAYRYEGSAQSIQVDRELMTHIVTNLLGNAIKYSPNGGEVTFSVRTDDQHIVYEISDQGIGIPAKDLPHLFQMFKRASNTRDHKIKGTGLGLMIVKQCVEAQGGRIHVQSQQDKGTTFTVTLPLRPKPRNG